MSVFHLGGAPGVPEQAGTTLKARFPGFRLAGAYSPPKADLLDMDHDAILGRLKASNPDILYVAFGAPKQEKWINMHVSQWKVPLALGIGGSLDFLAGTQKRAPRWMQKTGTEWIWRFGTNPARFWKRYGANFLFLIKAIWTIRRLKGLPLQAGTPHLPPPDCRAQVRVCDWQPVPDDQTACRVLSRYAQAMDDRQPILVNLEHCAWLDSRELGVLLSLGRMGKQRCIPVLSTGVADRVRRWLAFNGLDTLIEEAAPETDWRSMNKPAGVPLPAIETDAGRLRLIPPADLTAVSLHTWRGPAESAVNALHADVRIVEVDTTDMRFIDSAALGFLIALKKQVESGNRRFLVTHMSPAVQATMRIARLETFLGGETQGGKT